MNAQEIAFSQSVSTNSQSEKCFFSALGYFGLPTSFNDIGCGDGHLVELAGKLDIVCFGLDLNCEAHKVWFGEVVQGDISNWKSKALPEADLTFCLEFAEHVPEDQAEDLCNILYRATKDILVFSWAYSDSSRSAESGKNSSSSENQREETGVC